MFLGDILWSVAKIGGHYLSGDLQDVLYVACYVPMAFAGREQMRLSATASGTESSASMPLAQSLPYASMLTAFLVLVSFTRGDIGSPATVMTIVVFGLALLVMVRQALVLRDDALIRERRAARMVEERYASLIANASDVIMTDRRRRLTALCISRFRTHARSQAGSRRRQESARGLDGR